MPMLAEKSRSGKIKKIANSRNEKIKQRKKSAIEISNNVRNRSGTKLEENIKCPTNQTEK